MHSGNQYCRTVQNISHKSICELKISWTWRMQKKAETENQEAKHLTQEHIDTLRAAQEQVEIEHIDIDKSNQLFKDGRMQRSSDGSRFAYPPNMTHINFRLNGSTILFDNGLHMTRATAHSDTDAKVLYNYMFYNKLTTDSFDSFFPKSPKTQYKCVFPLDLTTLGVDKPSDLTIECRFATGSPSDYYIVMFMPESVTISRANPSSIWETTATIS